VTQQDTIDVPENVPAKTQWGTKAKAILAGGLVLGVGAAITLAAWTDTEWATGNFSTGQFGIEGSLDASTWASNPTSPGATLMFSAATPTDLTPGDVVYEGYAIRLEQNSTKAASVAITQSNASAIAGTTAVIHSATSTDCDAEEFDDGAAIASFNLNAKADVQYVCIQVTAGSQATLSKGATGSFSWTFTATSGATLTP
jgi:predicted ribosomally synthesized peptide with SipW-like signal peptide